VTAFLALAGTALASVAAAISHWSKYALISAPNNEIHRGLWDWLDLGDAHYCEGWVIATTVMILLAACFFYFTLATAIAVLVQRKKPWKTRPFRLAMAYLAFVTFLWTILAVCFWIAHQEWPPCWTEASGSTWGDVNSTYQYTKYGTAWILACVACGVAMLMTLTACWAVGKTPKPPLPLQQVEPEYQYPEVHLKSYWGPKAAYVPPVSYPAVTQPTYTVVTQPTYTQAAPVYSAFSRPATTSYKEAQYQAPTYAVPHTTTSYVNPSYPSTVHGPTSYPPLASPTTPSRNLVYY